MTGLRLPHTVVVDPGHGGVDPGNPGPVFPAALAEKDITLSIGQLLRAELMRRGLSVRAHAHDRHADRSGRSGRVYCRSGVRPVRQHSRERHAARAAAARQVNGVETYFLSDAKTEDQKRVAQDGERRAALRCDGHSRRAARVHPPGSSV